MCVEQCVVFIASGTQCRAHSYPKRATHGRGEQPVYSSGAHCISICVRIYARVWGGLARASVCVFVSVYICVGSLSAEENDGARVRGEQSVYSSMWCLVPVVLNAVPIHTQCSHHYLRDEAAGL